METLTGVYNTTLSLSDTLCDQCVHEQGIAIRREVDHFFPLAVPLGNNVPMHELKDPVPDAELSLPAFNVLTGNSNPRSSLKPTLLELSKTMRYGVTYIARCAPGHHGCGSSVERSLSDDIQRGLTVLDAAWHNTKPGQKGPSETSWTCRSARAHGHWHTG
eukprot:jgi/Tetstr1/428622/TSEL_018611.t1